ncbi:MAG: DUF2339 domain-containing protein, partial [Thermoguttaceae bacterium]|nr:DUF2339 domain-containing protein [Thermoguttaceae bacterium]
MEFLQLLTLIGLAIVIYVLVQEKEAICQKLDEISRKLSRETSDQKKKSGAAPIPGQIGQKLAEVQNKIQEKIQEESPSAAQNITPEPAAEAKPERELPPMFVPKTEAKPETAPQPEPVLEQKSEAGLETTPEPVLESKSEAGPKPASEPKPELQWKPFPVEEPKAEWDFTASPAWNWFWYGQEELEPDANREFLAASNWLIRFGMLVLVLGLGFFVKYSIDRGWLGPEMRILGTTLLGLGMYAAGIRFWHTKMNLLGQALMAGSACVLYFSAFGATELYHLIPRGMGFNWCLAVTLLLVVTALRWNSRLVAVLGTLGAYLTPVLFPFILDDQTQLMLYLALPAIGILTIRRFREWVLPLWIAFLGTYALLMAAAVPSWNAAKPEFLWKLQVQIVSILFFMGVFHLAAQRRVRNLVTAATPGDLVLAALNGFLFLVALTDSLSFLPDYYVVFYGLPGLKMDAQMAWLGIPAAGYLLAGFLLKKTPENRTFRAMNCLLALLALGFGLTNILSFSLIVPSVLLLLCIPFHSACQKVPSNAAVQIVRFFGSLLAICILLATAFWPYYMLEDPGFLDRFLRAGLPGVSLIFLALSVYGVRDSQTLKNSREFTWFFGVLAALQLFAWLTIEMWVSAGRYLPSMRQGALSIAWTLFALGLLL